ncbi:MAG: glycoside hydrolase family 28 protein, partial [Lachnospiraceae bacterium]
GDDCIAIKSGKIYMGKKHKTPSRKISIRHCLMEKGHGAVTIGSEIAGGVKEVTVSHCMFLNTDRGLRIKTRRGRGKDSIVDGIFFNHISMNEVKSPFVVNCFYYCDPDGRTEYVGTLEALPVDDRTPSIRSLHFKDIECKNAHHTGVCIYGLPEQKVESVVMENVSIEYSPQAREGIAAMMLACEPTCRQGIFARNVKSLELKDVSIQGAVNDYDLENIDHYNISPSHAVGK